ncbi:MAG: hypothetical protein ACI8S2_001448 [Bacteroidia bacterium]|jgi:hypothetical protein
MKKSFKLMLIFALGAGVLTLNSCSDKAEEETTPETTPATTTCYVTQETSTDQDGSYTVNYEYNSDDQLQYSIEDGDSMIFEYSGGRVAVAIDGLEESTFIYPAASNTPERINIKYDGVATGFVIIVSGADGITKVENHEYDAEENAVLVDVTNFTYTNGLLSGAITQSYDAETEEFSTDLEIETIVLDGKKNPYNGDIAFLFVNDFSPIAASSSNIVSAQIVTELGNFEYTSTYTYNEHNYPANVTASIFGQTNTIAFTYNCK